MAGKGESAKGSIACVLLPTDPIPDGFQDMDRSFELQDCIPSDIGLFAVSLVSELHFAGMPVEWDKGSMVSDSFFFQLSIEVIIELG